MIPPDPQTPSTGGLARGITWVGSEKVNVEVALFVECLLVRIQSIHPPVTGSFTFVKTLIPIFQELVSSVETRVLKIDWSNFLTYKLLFVLLKHIADYRISEAKSKNGTDDSKKSIMHFLQPHSALTKVLKLDCKYPPTDGCISSDEECLEIADSEEAYHRHLALRLVNGLLPMSSRNRLFKTFLVDVSSNLVIKNLVSYLTSPTSISMFIIQVLGTEECLSDIYNHPSSTQATADPDTSADHSRSYNSTLTKREPFGTLRPPLSKAVTIKYRAPFDQVSRLLLRNSTRDRLAKKRIQDSIVKLARGGKNFLKNNSPRTCITNNIIKVSSCLHKRSDVRHDPQKNATPPYVEACETSIATNNTGTKRSPVVKEPYCHAALLSPHPIAPNLLGRRLKQHHLVHKFVLQPSTVNLNLSATPAFSPRHDSRLGHRGNRVGVRPLAEAPTRRARLPNINKIMRSLNINYERQKVATISPSSGNWMPYRSCSDSELCGGTANTSDPLKDSSGATDVTAVLDTRDTASDPSQRSSSPSATCCVLEDESIQNIGDFSDPSPQENSIVPAQQETLLSRILRSSFFSKILYLYSIAGAIIHLSSKAKDLDLPHPKEEKRNYGRWIFQLVWFVFRFDESQNRFTVYLLSVIVTSLCAIIRTTSNRVISYLAYSLVSEDFVVYYIRTLRESIFTEQATGLQVPADVITPGEVQIRDKAFNTIMERLPFLSSILGQGHMEKVVDEIMNAFQDPDMNKYFAYSLLDTITNELLPPSN